MNNRVRSRVLMVYPNAGLEDALVSHPPLGLLYASTELVKNGIDVDILDARLYPHTWKEQLKKAMGKGLLAVGISVISGEPVKSAVEIGKLVKSVDKDVKVVWGGPHATFFPDSILGGEWHCDYVIRGRAIKSFYELVKGLFSGKVPRNVKGLSYISDGKIVHVPCDDTGFEFCNYKEIPYDLIEDYSLYGQLDRNERVFSVYGSLGCPHKCSFCSSPREYANINGKRWIPLPAGEVVDHIEYLVEKYKANYIYFIDDDAFVDSHHVNDIADEIVRRKLNIGVGFRGVRIDEINKISDSLFNKLLECGVNMLHIGAESGSDRMLKLMHKGCSVEDIISANKRLAKYPSITAAYNFLIGLPAETFEDLESTKALMMCLVKDNPNCIVFAPNRYRPVPGTELFDVVQKEWGYKPPSSIKEWSEVRAGGEFDAPWLSKKIKKYCNMLFVTSYFMDNKVQRLTSGNTVFYRILRLASRLYGPIARLRVRHSLYQGLVEYKLYRVIARFVKRETVKKVA
ncbi:B12-binding domain-containing radical SAM protein [Candidatus Omnitrophota bacterium]